MAILRPDTTTTLNAGEYPDLLNQAKFGVLLGTIVAGMLGYMVLNAVLPKVKDK